MRNPIDLVAGATAEQFEQAMRVALHDDGIDALLAIFVPPLVTRRRRCRPRDRERRPTSAGDKPVVACFLGRAGVPAGTRGGDGGSRRTIPSFAFPEAAAHALGRVAELADWRRRPVGESPGVRRRRPAPGAARSSPARSTPHPDGAWLDQRDAARAARVLRHPGRRVLGRDRAPTSAVAAAERARISRSR